MADTAFSVAHDIEQLAVGAATRVRQVTVHYGQLLQTAVKRRASLPRGGPPGPRIITGDYNRSIGMKLVPSRGSIGVSVGTDKPQGWRLELGFHGTDSAGRTYNQPAYPHFGPALDEVGPKFTTGVLAAALPRGVA